MEASPFQQCTWSVLLRIVICSTLLLCGNKAVVLGSGSGGSRSSSLAGLLPRSTAGVLNSGTTSKMEPGAFPRFLPMAFPFSMQLSESVEGHSRCVSWRCLGTLALLRRFLTRSIVSCKSGLKKDPSVAWIRYKLCNLPIFLKPNVTGHF